MGVDTRRVNVVEVGSTNLDAMELEYFIQLVGELLRK